MYGQYGLSLTTFSLACQWKGPARAVPGVVSCTVSNDGGIAGDEVLMLFHAAGTDVRAVANHPVPIRSLIDFDRVSVPSGGTATVEFHVDQKSLELIDENFYVVGPEGPCVCRARNFIPECRFRSTDARINSTEPA